MPPDPPPPPSDPALTLSMMLNILHCNINIFKLLVHSLHFFYVKKCTKKHKMKQKKPTKTNKCFISHCCLVWPAGVFQTTTHFLFEKSPKQGAISRYYMYIYDMVLASMVASVQLALLLLRNFYCETSLSCQPETFTL